MSLKRNIKQLELKIIRERAELQNQFQILQLQVHQLPFSQVATALLGSFAVGFLLPFIRNIGLKEMIDELIVLSSSLRTFSRYLPI